MKNKIIIVFFLLVACGSLENAGKALRNGKVRTTDEFLIEKRGPLSVPPKVGELPKPNSSGEIKKENKNILVIESEDAGQREKSELENIFLEEIRKN